MKKFFSRFVNCGFGIIFSIFILLTFIYMIKDEIKNGPLIILGAILLAGAAFTASYFLTKLQPLFENKIDTRADASKVYSRIFLCMTAGLLVLQCIVAFTADLTQFNEPYSDLGYVCLGAKNYITKGISSIYDNFPEDNMYYFAVYPNNHALTLIILFLYKIEYALFGKIGHWLPFILNIIGLNLSYILMYKTAKLLYSPAKALSCAVKGLLFSPIITYAFMYYTDAVGMPFVSAAIYFYVKWRKQKAEAVPVKNRIINLIICGLLIGIGYKIKGSLAILLPAILLDLLFQQKGLKSKLIPFALLIVPVGITTILIGALAGKVLKISDEDYNKYKFPAVHWVMMSASGRGGFELEEYQYTFNAGNYDEKVSADIDRLKNKISDLGPWGFAKHLAKKANYTWKGGPFMIGYYVPNGKFFNSTIFKFLTNFMYYTLIFGVIRSFLTKFKSDNDVMEGNFIFKVTLMGLAAFLLIWEARCRYVVSFFIIFALL